MPIEQRDAKLQALERVLQVVSVKSASAVMYGAAILGVAALIPDLQLPPQLAAIAGGIGANLLSTIIDRVAQGQASDDDIKQAVEGAIAQSGIDKVLTKDDFDHAFAHLLKVLRSLQGSNNEILTILHRLESVVSTGQQRDTLGVTLEDLGRLRESLANHLRRQITREKNSKRYIPDVFVEVSHVKDKVRFFAHPVLFINKVVEKLNHLNFTRLNSLLSKLSLKPIYLSLPEGFKPSEAISEVENQASLLVRILEEARNAAEAYSKLEPAAPLEAIPPEKRYIYKEIWWPLNGASSALTRRIGECLDDLTAIQSQVLFIISRAGQGKTNFVCDFAENVLLKRAIPCLFFAGRELSRVDADRIGSYILRSTLGVSDGESIDEMLKGLEKLSLTDQVPVVIIIDGINEHKDLGVFSHQLEQIIESFLQYRGIKFILTCRSEYFEQRFKNLREASFAGKTYFVENLERYTSQMHRDHLLQAYLDFFKLSCPYLSQPASEALENDTLLLRMFCEAYGDHLSEREIYLPQLMDIYKDEVFRMYLDKKLEGASQHHADTSRLSVGIAARYKRILTEIIRLMIGREQFSDIPVVDLADEYYAPLAEMIGEDIVFRKDLVEGKSVLDEKSEVVNFTFDEFRDFLIADYLVMVTFKEDIEKFKHIVDRLVAPTSPVAEGLRKFIFLASKRPEGRQIHDVIAESRWYKSVFLEEIFSVQEEHITQDDLREIESRFLESNRNSRWIIVSLVRRYRADVYKVLNIDLLFHILDSLDEPGYELFVKSALSTPPWYGTSWPIEYLADYIRSILTEENPDCKPCFEKLVELLIYLFDVQGPRHIYPAFEVFREFAETQTEVAIGLLEKHTGSRSIGIVAQVWNMLGHLSRRSSIPQMLVEMGCKALLELDDMKNAQASRAAIAVKYFLISCRDSMHIELPDDISQRLERVMVTPLSWRP
jgi:hypothetical protein